MADTHVTSALPTQPDLFANRIEAIRALIKSHVGFATVEKFHRPISLQASIQVKFPACFVHPETWDPQLVSNAKYDLRGTVGLFVYVTGTEAEAVGEEVVRAAGILEKLFSNNAFDDRNTGAPTNRFFSYPGYWVESQFGPVTIAPVLSSGSLENDQVFLGAAKCGFRFHDVLFE